MTEFYNNEVLLAKTWKSQPQNQVNTS